jgi:hypothetical protein
MRRRLSTWWRGTGDRHAGVGHSRGPFLNPTTNGGEEAAYGSGYYIMDTRSTALFGSDVPAAFIGFNLVSIPRVIARQSKAVGCGERSGGTDGAAVVAA